MNWYPMPDDVVENIDGVDCIKGQPVKDGEILAVCIYDPFRIDNEYQVKVIDGRVSIEVQIDGFRMHFSLNQENVRARRTGKVLIEKCPVCKIPINQFGYIEAYKFGCNSCDCGGSSPISLVGAEGI